MTRTAANALVIAGGGQYASYNAGLLVGWTESGCRPTFDLVTGISSGALVAPYAFLGPKYDSKLSQFFTTVSDKDIYQLRPIRQFVRKRALADATRLEELLDSQVTSEFMTDLRQAHAEGRRLYLGTMNVTTRRLTVWDVGAIASSDHPDARLMVRNVLLAAGSIPGLLPAVKFDVQVNGVRYTEEHIDGGAVCQSFLRLAPGMERPDDASVNWLKGSNLYALAAGKLYADPIRADPGLLLRVTSTVSAALYALFRAELMGMYAFCVTSGMKFHTKAIPQEIVAPANSMTFEPAEMRKLYAIGYDEGRRGANIRWRLTPPGTEPGEEEAPRDVEPLFPPTQPFPLIVCPPAAVCPPSNITPTSSKAPHANHTQP